MSNRPHPCTTSWSLDYTDFHCDSPRAVCSKWHLLKAFDQNFFFQSLTKDTSHWEVPCHRMQGLYLSQLILSPGSSVSISIATRGVFYEPEAHVQITINTQGAMARGTEPSSHRQVESRSESFPCGSWALMRQDKTRRDL